jgi:hypothetical protein
MKPMPASLGIRVRSGTACAIVLIGSESPQRVVCRQTLDLCDPAIPSSRQPYHAVMNAGAARAREVEEHLCDVVQKATQKSVDRLLADACQESLSIHRGALVVGSRIDPARIANEHIRAHAQEGQLFRTAVLNSLKNHRLDCEVFVERDIYDRAARMLQKSADEIKLSLKTMGRDKTVSWRAEEKLAALAAWMISAVVGE